MQDTEDSKRVTLVADIGGTNTRVAYARGGEVDTSTIRRFRNSRHRDLGDVLSRFLEAEPGPRPAAACVAVAGPVRDGRASMTNLPWTLDEATLAAATGARDAVLVNDLEAQGHGLDVLAAGSVRHLFGPAPGTRPGDRLVIGIGTGFNTATVVAGPDGPIVKAAEAGHARLPVLDARGLSLASFVARAHGFPAIEDVLSGRGLENVAAWLGADAPTAAGIVAALDKGDAVAAEALRVFARILGSVAGDLALCHLPFGGVYLVGGVARALGPHLVEAGMPRAFTDKGRFSDFMAAFGCHLVDDDYAALHGCAAILARRGAARKQGTTA